MISTKRAVKPVLVFALAILIICFLCGCGTAKDTGAYSCTISISCKTARDNIDKCLEQKKQCVPEDGVILAATQISFDEGASVFDILDRACKANKIQLEFTGTPVNQSIYIEGINNLYEFDVTALSGWLYKVNDYFPNYSCSKYAVKDGDVICVEYTCNLGEDIGGAEAYGQQ